MKPILTGLLALTVAGLALLAYRTDQTNRALAQELAAKDQRIAAMAAQHSALMAELDQLSAAAAAAAPPQDTTPFSDVDLQAYGESCRLWIAQSLGDAAMAVWAKDLILIADSWIKDGAAVFELAVPTAGNGPPRLMLCVIDPARHRMFTPRPFEAARWRRNG